MFLLPNPSRTTTEVEANLLYVDDVQVLSEQDDDVGEGANLHQEEEYHGHEAGEFNENQRWAWMHNRLGKR